jgi:mRNA interferase MazF
MARNRGDVVLVEVHFHQTHGAKVRPAVVVLDSGDEDFLGAPITTRVRAGGFDLNLAGWQVAVLAKRNIRR